MKVEVDKSELGICLNRLQGAVVEKSIGILSINVTTTSITLMSTDRILAIYCALKGEILEEGQAFIPIKIFSEMVRELPQGKVSLSINDSWLYIRGVGRGAFELKIPHFSDTLWQEPTKISDASNNAKIPSNLMAYMIEQVQFCIEQDAQRNYGTVGYFHKLNEESIRLVGCDGYRLSYCDIQLHVSKTFLSKGICLSKRALLELLKMSNEGFEELKIVISDDNTMLQAQVEGYSIYILLSAIKYPDYENVLPSQHTSTVKIQCNELQHVIKRILLASDRTKAVKLRFKSDELTLVTQNTGNAEGKEQVSLDGYTGPAAQLTINGKFLNEIFITTASSEVLLQFSKEEDPMVVTPISEPDHCRSLHVLVPICESN